MWLVATILNSEALKCRVGGDILDGHFNDNVYFVD